MRDLVVSGGGDNMRRLVVDWGDSVVNGSDSLVVSRGSVMGTSHVVRLLVVSNGGLVLNVDGVLDVVHGGVDQRLVMSDMRVLGVVRLGHLGVDGLVMSGLRLVGDNGN